MNANLQKYLKYKSKYLDLKNELEGGVYSDKLKKQMSDIGRRLREPDIFFLNKKKNLPKLKKEERSKKYENLKRQQILRLQKLLELQILLINKIKFTLIKYVITNKSYLPDNQYEKKHDECKKEINVIMSNAQKYLDRYNVLIQAIGRNEDEDEEQYGGYKKLNLNQIMEINTEIDNFTKENILEEEKDNKQQIDYKLSLFKQKEKELRSEIESIDTIIKKMSPSEAVASDDRDPPNRNRNGNKNPPPDDSDSNNFDCEELKKNIAILCEYYKNIKDNNDAMKTNIVEVFSTVNDVVKKVNKLQNTNILFSDEDLKSISEENQKILKKEQLPEQISLIHLKIKDASEKEKKKLIEHYSFIPAIKAYYN